MRQLFKAEELPVFQNKMFRDRQLALSCPKGDVVLVQDKKTGLIYNAAFDAAKLEYDEDYQNEQACSAVIQQHLEGVEAVLRERFLRKSLVEIGCGKGYFLEYLNDRGYQVAGVDPAYEGDNPCVMKAYYGAGLGLRGEGIILRHVLNQIQHPVDFLSAIAEGNGGKGVIYIELACFDWVCRNRAWFDIQYECVNYFRLQDFHRMFGTVYDSGHLFGGQYLYVIADLATLRRPVLEDKAELIQFPEDFLVQVDLLAKRRDGKRNVIWGGASKGEMFSLYMQRRGVDVDLVVDINPAKQGKFLPVTGLRVSSPEEALEILEPGEELLVMNSNYLAEIAELTGHRFRYLAVDGAHEPAGA